MEMVSWANAKDGVLATVLVNPPLLWPLSKRLREKTILHHALSLLKFDEL